MTRDIVDLNKESEEWLQRQPVDFDNCNRMPFSPPPPTDTMKKNAFKEGHRWAVCEVSNAIYKHIRLSGSISFGISEKCKCGKCMEFKLVEEDGSVVVSDEDFGEFVRKLIETDSRNE